jgi:hypothetical protein
VSETERERERERERETERERDTHTHTHTHTECVRGDLSPQGRRTPTRKHVPVKAGVVSARGKQGAGGGRRRRRVFSRLALARARTGHLTRRLM